MGAGKSATIRLRLTIWSRARSATPSSDSKRIQEPLDEASDFYKSITPELERGRALVMRQALAGMLWTKQYFFFDVHKWLEEHGIDPMKLRRTDRAKSRLVPHGESTPHLDARQVGVPLVCGMGSGVSYHRARAVDTDFAKEQLGLMLHESTCIRPGKYLPTSGTSAMSIRRCMPGPRCFLYRFEQALHGKATSNFLEALLSEVDAELQLVGEPQDRFGHNLFEGGFLGLDNIGVFDRSSPLPTGGSLRAG